MAVKPYFASEPDYVPPPGETIIELLELHGMSQTELARRMGRPPEQVSRLIHARIGIEPETAIQLERTLGMTAAFWMNLESNYREHLAREKERERLDTHVGWLKTLPIKDMVAQKWIPEISHDVSGLRKVLDFFGVASPEQFDAVWKEMPVAARQSASYQSNPGAVAAWLRYGQKKAMDLTIPAYQPKVFQQKIGTIRGLTRLPFSEGMKQAIQLCMEAGVVVLLVHEIHGMRFHGAVQWLGNKPIMQLTLRRKRADITWFSFFHEAGHILLHPKNTVFIEDKDSKSVFEEQADQFASDLLIKPDMLIRFDQSKITPGYIRDYAETLGIGHDILLGRLLNKEIVEYGGRLNSLLQAIDWSSIDPSIVS